MSMLVPPRNVVMRRLAAGVVALGALAWNEAPDAARQRPGFPAAVWPSRALTDGEWRQVERGEAVVRVLPARNPDLGILAVSTLRASPSAVADRVGRIAELKKSALVPDIQRFSEPPVLGDLAALTLNDADLAEARACRPGDCGLKLATAEMAALRRVAASAGAGWKAAVQDEFRRLLLARVLAYRAGGLAALPDNADDETPTARARELAAILAASPELQQGLPQLAAYLRDYPRVPMTGVESFLYWSTEQFGAKPVVMITHVSILRGSGPGVPALVIAGTLVFATHYLNGGLSLTSVVTGPEGAPNHLIYLNRLRVDALGGFAGGLKRAIVERRIRRSAGELVTGFRRRLDAQ